MADGEGSTGFLWFLAGLGVGAVVGVLYAPKSGDEMRDVIRSKAQEGSDKARATSQAAQHSTGVFAALPEVLRANIGQFMVFQ